MFDPRYPSAPASAGQIVVPDRLTPFTDVELGSAMIAAHRAIFGADLSRPALCCLLAQCVLETGHRSTHCFNIGNVKASDRYRGTVTYFRCNELEHGVLVWYDPFNPACRFRAFATLAGGAEQHLRFLGTATRGTGLPNHYQAAWDAALRGDPVAFCAELSRAGYFTAGLALYTKGFTALFKQLSASLPVNIDVPTHTHEPDVLQSTSGHSAFSQSDFDRILLLQLPPIIDWDELRAERDRLIKEESP